MIFIATMSTGYEFLPIPFFTNTDSYLYRYGSVLLFLADTDIRLLLLIHTDTDTVFPRNQCDISAVIVRGLFI